MFATYFVYKGLKKPEFIVGMNGKPKYATLQITSEDRDLHLQKLISYMENQKPYLSPSLFLNDLAEQVSIPPRYLSQELNDYLNQNFLTLLIVIEFKRQKKISNSAAKKKL